MTRLIKKMLPRGLYGRAALIMLVPILTIQLVVSAAFLQRHFDGVTRQMMAGVAVELRFIIQEINKDGIWAGRNVAAPLEITLYEGGDKPFDGPQMEARLFYDLSGRSVIEVLRRAVPEVTWIDLASNDRQVMLGLSLADGTKVDVEIARRRVSASNPHQLLVLMVFTGILMTTVAFLFLRNQLRPIRRLARAAEDFGKGRVVDYSPAGALEVRSAGRAFLDMRNRIESQIEQRTMMLSGVSHDLRTPLTRMKLGLSVMEEGEDVSALRRDVAEMETLLEAFLDFARGDALDDLAELDIDQFLREVVADAKRAGAEIQFLRATRNAGLSDYSATLRPAALRRALDNLISNAQRYGTHARVTLSPGPRHWRIAVEDDGPGIPADQRAMAMRPFVRLDAARNQDRGSGVGLGLAIAQDIARRHGGRLSLGTSADLGGLKAEIILPR
ncbi:ATP-binding protein [Rhodobacteraceae bacterium XHP0102]|nr:ATP-binding protein [Rhodobacteraceae bacterium XHP0102]